MSPAAHRVPKSPFGAHFQFPARPSNRKTLNTAKPQSAPAASTAPRFLHRSTPAEIGEKQSMHGPMQSISFIEREVCSSNDSLSPLQRIRQNLFPKKICGLPQERIIASVALFTLFLALVALIGSTLPPSSLFPAHSSLSALPSRPSMRIPVELSNASVKVELREVEVPRAGTIDSVASVDMYAARAARAALVPPPSADPSPDAGHVKRSEVADGVEVRATQVEEPIKRRGLSHMAPSGLHSAKFRMLYEREHTVERSAHPDNLAELFSGHASS